MMDQLRAGLNELIGGFKKQSIRVEMAGIISLMFAGTAFKTVFEDHQQIGTTNWFTIALQKV